jgi:3-dehydroshikimate dehydratase
VKLSFCSIAYQQKKWSTPLVVETDLRDIIPRVRQAGYDGIEIWEPHLRGFDESGLRDLGSTLVEAGLAVPMISPYFNFTKSPDHIRDSLDLGRRLIETCQPLRPAALRCFTGTASHQATPKQWQGAADALRELATIAAAHGMFLALETHAWNLMDTVDSTFRLLDMVHHPALGIIFQPSTFAPDHLAAMDRLRPHIRHIHATNNKEGQACTLAGGEMCWRTILDRLQEQPFEGFISVEWFGSEPDAALQREAAYLHSLA